MLEMVRMQLPQAAEQSHRSEIPEVHAPASFKQLLSMSGEYDACLVA
jgi:16S rRNA (uracil1498-N3)-methyltransferase